MIDWLQRVDPDRVFLKTAERVWTYGETVDAVVVRRSSEHVIVEPTLTADSIFDVLAGLAGPGVTVVGDGQVAGPDDDSLLVVYTSGSSGKPKGVRLTLENLEAASRASVEHLGHASSDTWLLAMPLHHVGGLSIVVRSMFTGGAVRLLEGFEPRSFAASMRQDVTMISVVPTMLRRVLDVDSAPYTGLRAVLVGGGPIPDGLLEEAVTAGLPVLPSYGMTETFGQIATLRPGAPVARHAHPLPGVELRTDSQRRIQVRGAQVSPGYVGEPDREDEWFTTGDLGEIDDEGALRVVGRVDDMIITGGKKVDPRHVEGILMAHPNVIEAVVFGVRDERWGERVSCAVVGDVDDAALLEWLRDQLPGFMVPKSLRVVDELPRTSIGKPDRESLRSDG